MRAVNESENHDVAFDFYTTAKKDQLTTSTKSAVLILWKNSTSLGHCIYYIDQQQWFRDDAYFGVPVMSNFVKIVNSNTPTSLMFCFFWDKNALELRRFL